MSTVSSNFTLQNATFGKLNTNNQLDIDIKEVDYINGQFDNTNGPYTHRFSVEITRKNSQNGNTLIAFLMNPSTTGTTKDTFDDTITAILESDVFINYSKFIIINNQSLIGGSFSTAKKEFNTSNSKNWNNDIFYNKNEEIIQKIINTNQNFDLLIATGNIEGSKNKYYNLMNILFANENIKNKFVVTLSMDLLTTNGYSRHPHPQGGYSINSIYPINWDQTHSTLNSIPKISNKKRFINK